MNQAERAFDEAIAEAEAAGVYDRAVYDVSVERFGALGMSEAWAEHGPLRGRDAVEALVRGVLSTLGPLDRADIRVTRHHTMSEESAGA